MTTLKLGIDLDGTSCHYDNGLRAFHGTRLGIPQAQWKTAMPDLIDYAFHKNGWVGMDTFEEFWAVHLDAVRDGLFARLEAFKHFAEVTARLADAGHEINIVTARELGPELEAIVEETTLEFLSKSGATYHNLLFKNNKGGLGFDLWHDDAPHNVEQLRAEGSVVVIADQGHNRHLEGFRATNWLQFEEIVNAVAAENTAELAVARVA